MCACSVKSASDSPPKAIGGTANVDGPGTGTEAGMGSGSSAQDAELASSWLANLAIGDATTAHSRHSLVLQFTFVLATSIILSHIHL